MAQAKPFSISLGSKKSLPSINKKRPHSSLVEDESDTEERPQTELVLGFDASGVSLGTTPENQPLVIGGQKNREWREEAQRKQGHRNLLPAEEQARRRGERQQNAAVPDEPEKERTWGLVVAQKEHEVDRAPNGEDEEHQKPERKPQTADEEALAALLGEEKKDSGLVIPNVATTDERFAPRTEGDVFRADVDARPEAASLAEYTTVPVEDFGRALMRGMGWKEGMEIGRNKNVSIKEKGKKEERRAARLGIGAKELPQELAEPGAWGKGAKRGKKELSTYTPLRLKNKATGEVLTEEEHKMKQENSKLLLDEDKDKRSEKENRGSSSRHMSHKDRSDRDYDRERSQRHRDYDGDPNRGSSKRESYRERDRERDYDRRDRDRDRDNGHKSRRDRDDHDDKYRNRDRHYDRDRRHGSDRLNDRNDERRHR
jgi:hypothetical protein